MASPELPPQTGADGGRRMVFVGLDFGTTFSSISFAPFDHQGQIDASTCEVYRSEFHDYEGPKVPTKVPIRECDHNQQSSDVWLEWFKLCFLNKNDVSPDVRDSPKLLRMIRDLWSAKISYVEATGTYLRKLWNQFYEELEYLSPNHIVRLTVTVPVIWPMYARREFLKAIHKADILSSKVELAPKFLVDTEAAVMALLSRLYKEENNKSSSLKIGDLIIICNCGGIIVDSIAYEIVSLKPFSVKERIPGESIFAGGALLDDAFMSLLKTKVKAICPAATFKTLTERDFEDFARQHWEHDMKISHTVNSRDRQFSLPLTWTESTTIQPNVGIDAQVSFSPSELESVFDPIVHKIVNLVESQMNQVKDGTNKNTSHVVVAGGFGRNEYVQDKIVQAVKRLCSHTITHCYANDEGWASVSKGAVLHAIQTHALENVVEVRSRVARGSYGVYDIHENSVIWLVKEGDHLSSIHPTRRVVPIRALTPGSRNPSVCFIRVYRKMRADVVEREMCRISWANADIVPTFAGLQGPVEIEFKWDGNVMEFSLVYNNARQDVVRFGYSGNI